MISCELFGRLGNQAFQIAACIAHAKKMGTTYQIPNSTVDARVFPMYFNNFPKHKHVHNLGSYVEPKFSYTPIPDVDDIKLSGYFQSEKYFSGARSEVLNALGFPKDANNGFCAIHIRLGDYVKYSDKHPPVNEDYIGQAIETIIAKTGVRHFMVFSDDIDGAMDILYEASVSEIGLVFTAIRGGTPLQDVYAMSLCSHFIISNSTFSWWSAWACNNPDKVVVTPSEGNWFGYGNRHLDVSDLIPESWIRITY